MIVKPEGTEMGGSSYNLGEIFIFNEGFDWRTDRNFAGAKETMVSSKNALKGLLNALSYYHQQEGVIRSMVFNEHKL